MRYNRIDPNLKAPCLTKDCPWKVPQPVVEIKSDLCWWEIRAEKNKWKSGKIIYKFTKKEIGINIMAFGSEEHRGFGHPDLVKIINDSNN